MDYSTMKHKLSYNAYKNEEDFGKDICLVYDNCVKYNGENSDYGRLAIRLKEEYEKSIKREFFME
jgi:histone acetyltransferase